jgi:hypothetical protein
MMNSLPRRKRRHGRPGGGCGLILKRWRRGSGGSGSDAWATPSQKGPAVVRVHDGRQRIRGFIAKGLIQFWAVDPVQPDSILPAAHADRHGIAVDDLGNGALQDDRLRAGRGGVFRPQLVELLLDVLRGRLGCRARLLNVDQGDAGCVETGKHCDHEDRRHDPEGSSPGVGPGLVHGVFRVSVLAVVVDWGRWIACHVYHHPVSSRRRFVFIFLPSFLLYPHFTQMFLCQG